MSPLHEEEEPDRGVPRLLRLPGRPASRALDQDLQTSIEEIHGRGIETIYVPTSTTRRQSRASRTSTSTGRTSSASASSSTRTTTDTCSRRSRRCSRTGQPCSSSSSNAEVQPDSDWATSKLYSSPSSANRRRGATSRCEHSTCQHERSDEAVRRRGCS